MNDLFQDAWQDLREKRLLPIALVLLLAIVAVPVLLTKSAAQPPSGEPVATSPEPDTRISVELDDGDAASSGSGSSLGKFAEGDPFTPPSGIAANADADSGPEASAAGPSDASLPGDGGSLPDSSQGVPVGAPPTTRTRTTEYEYVADVTLWTGERRRGFRGLRKLDMLPNQSAPVLIFMGTSGKGGNAVFLVDSTLEAAGEGRCVPDRKNCAYVHIGPGAEHAFTTDEGDSYRLRVEEIRRVEVRAGASAAGSRARTSVGDGGAERRFQLPSLVDLVAVDSTETAPTPETTSTDKRSSGAAGGR